MPSETFSIRAMQADDVSEVHAMLRELAHFEELADQLTASEKDMHDALFVQRHAEALVAEIGDGSETPRTLIGYAIFFENFSTFLCRRGIYLEDLYVRPEYRKQGVGKTFLRKLANLALERNCGRMEWSVLDWNQNAIDVYQAIGGDVLPDWRIVRLTTDAIRRLAEG